MILRRIARRTETPLS